ncbi:Phosphoribosylformimino-5-aminoimidazole carboxamide ribotide isomerase [Catenaria anguillulae PL171]|uniref:1-(5-phosphoribosyl)-5-[(5-phosphoribosylamino)methylideneamino] imidazole-4-carboxamide isomerase n=1 Tax=Catenaria anguillulae PL171 TaxID=765915 RepID=A0A1Y2I6H7_9FUNG|nr:Phosphoribosylformimino-5-aminoimidazole carboxamide ribotide isomerase [Catenaria anguillulae PL171]
MNPRRSTQFRPCIDLHSGLVKQIVGGTLTTTATDTPATNFTSNLPAAHYASLYRQHSLHGGHVIMLGPGNKDAARDALAAWPDALQIGGGISLDNAQEWIDAGASKVIVTSWLFPDAKFDEQRLNALVEQVGKDRVVVDLSCRKRANANGEWEWVVAMDKWTRLTDMSINKDSLTMLAQYCCEFLIHAADVEGLCQGIDEELVKALGEWTPIPCTYAGGGRTLADLELVDRLSDGKVDLTIGSALDIFGGKGVTLAECVEWNKSHPRF